MKNILLLILFFQSIVFSNELTDNFIFKDKNHLKIIGTIKKGISNDFEFILKNNPKIELIELNSTGGLVEEGYKLNKLISKYKLNTYVENECSSSCLLAYMGGIERYFHKNAKLGVHSSFNILGDLKPKEDTLSIDVFLNKGVSRDFIINKIFGTKSSEIYFLTLDELVDNNIVNTLNRKKFNEKEFPWIQKLINWANNNNLPKYKYDKRAAFLEYTGFPRNPDTLLNIKTLNLFDCNLETLPKEFKNLTSLKILKLRKNNFNYIPDEIFNLKGLTYLGLSENNIMEIPTQIQNLKNLEELDLNYNYIEKISSDIVKLPKLNILHLEANFLGNGIFEILKNNKSITDLNLNYNNITSLDMNNIDKFDYIKLVGTFIQKKPKGFKDELYLDKDLLLEESNYEGLKDFYSYQEYFFRDSPKRVAKWFQLSAESVCIKCKDSYALDILYGDNPNKETKEKAIYYLEQASLKNNLESINHLTNEYKYMKNYEKSLFWANKALEFDKSTLITIGNIYNEMNNEDEAINYYKKAIKNGDVIAYAEMGSLYKNKKDYPNAIKSFKEGIKHGDNYSAMDLAEMYEKGLGLEINYNKAYKLYKSTLNYEDTINDGEPLQKILYLFKSDKLNIDMKRDLNKTLIKLENSYKDSIDIKQLSMLKKLYKYDFKNEIKIPDNVKEKIEYHFNNSLENITTGKIISLYSKTINYNKLGSISIIKLVDEKDNFIKDWAYIKHNINKINTTYLDKNGNYVVNLNIDSWLYSLKKEKGIKRQEEFEFIFDSKSLVLLSEVSKIKKEENYTPMFNNTKSDKFPYGQYIFNPEGGSGTGSSIDITKEYITIKSYGLGGTILDWEGSIEKFVNQEDFLLIDNTICRKNLNVCAKLYLSSVYK